MKEGAPISLQQLSPYVGVSDPPFLPMPPGVAGLWSDTFEIGCKKGLRERQDLPHHTPLSFRKVLDQFKIATTEDALQLLLCCPTQCLHHNPTGKEAGEGGVQPLHLQCGLEKGGACAAPPTTALDPGLGMQNDGRAVRLGGTGLVSGV